MKKWIIFLSFIIVCRIGYAQDLSFNKFSIEKGLSQTSALCFAEDKLGFIWIGTESGLNRFDAQHFKVYKNIPGNLHSLSSNYIHAILSDSKGRLWVGTSIGLNLFDPEKDLFIRFMNDKKNDSTISNNRIRTIYEDKKGRIWVGTIDGLNLLEDKSTLSFKRFPIRGAANAKGSQDIYSIKEDYIGQLWVSTNDELISLSMNLGKPYIQLFPYKKKMGETDPDYLITSIEEDPSHQLWLGTQGVGLFTFDQINKTIIPFANATSLVQKLPHNFVRKVKVDKKGTLWIGTQEGVVSMDLKTKRMVTYQHEPENKTSLSQNSIYDIFLDSGGNMWVGTYFGGINLVYASNTPFQMVQASGNKNGLSNNVVSCIIESKEKNLWIGTDGGGLNYLDRSTGKFSYFKYDINQANSLGSNLVKSIYYDSKGRMWVCTHGGGLNLLNSDNKTFTRYKFEKGKENSISSNNILCVTEDEKGMIWIGTEYKGVDMFDPITKTFSHYKDNYKDNNKDSGIGTSPFKAQYIRALVIDHVQQMWVGTELGLFVKKNGEQNITPFLHHFPDKKTLPKEYAVGCLFEDSKKQIWVGTRMLGIYLIQPKDNKMLQFSMDQGLPSNNIRSITEDLEGNIWVTTDNGISKYDVAQKTFIAYNLSDGLPGNEFNSNASYIDYKGTIYAGSLNGLVYFNPVNIQKNNATNNIVFTALKVGNEYIDLDKDQHILEKNINYANAITLQNGQNNFTVEFNILNYIKSDKNKFSYTLEGFEKGWNTTTTGAATYTNIAAGNYRLIVKGYNNDGVWNGKDAFLNIQILPPIWATWWAYCIYCIGIVLVILLVTRYFLLQAKYVQEKKLQQYKLDFFTNISHEIRTHLTLITSPLDAIIDQNNAKEIMGKQLLYIKKHTEKLSTLVGELLDFRKAETGNIVLNYEKEKLDTIIEEVKSSLQETAVQKGITLEMIVTQPDIFAYIDKQHFEKVITNIVYNAIKFTNQGGSICIELEKSKTAAIIKIRDNGIGIASKHFKNLFNNYFQINHQEKENAGYGIGLALSKSIIELHKGSIEVESMQQTKDQPGATVFTITIPLGVQQDTHQVTLDRRGHLQQEVAVITALEALEEVPLHPRLLLIEDNDELREFIKDVLSTNFIVEEAVNGEIGFAMAVKNIPDIIISDIMMPEMDGLELCKLVKKNPKTSHIPIILLTAKSSIDDQIDGLSHQADIYMTKPFNLKLLETQVINLIDNRRKLQDVYKQKFIHASSVAVSTTIEDKFLNDLIQTIEGNLENVDFNVAALSRSVAMSQPVLYKKLKALTGLSVNDFIKSIRLKRAAVLLQNKQHTIYEVAYMVGFLDRKYFSKEFKKAYGYTPTEYIEQV